MGITNFSWNTLRDHGALLQGLRMLELGDQNLYFDPHYGEYAKALFTKLGIDHTSVDLSAHEGGAVKMDLCQPIPLEYLEAFDVVTNFGTSEHCQNLYQVFKNINDACKVGGLIFHENPKTGSWPGHGFHYMTQEFYKELAKRCGYEIVDLGEWPAMGNTTDGWNVYCVLRKKQPKFLAKKSFERLDFRKA